VRARVVPWLTFAAFLLPVAAGLAATLAPAFGYLPALGETQAGLQAWRTLFAWPGLATSLAVTLFTGITATLLSLWLAIEIAARAPGTVLLRAVRRALPAALATPHAAAAIGLAVLLAPSGWLVRLLSPWATGWTRPPDLATIQDGWGLALIAGLVLKEVPYLLFMLLAALGQVRTAETMLLARTLGYTPRAAFWRTIVPQLWPQLRLPAWATLAYSLSAVDMALVLGPTSPPPFAVQVLRWLTAPDVKEWLPGAAGALLQVAIAAAPIVLWRAAEPLAGRVCRAVIVQGIRKPQRLDMGFIVAVALGLMSVGAAGAIVLWSVAGPWPFPSAWPASLSFAVWQRALPSLLQAAGTTAALAALTTLVALLLAVLWLEAERCGVRQKPRRLWWLLYAPLVLPQLAFLSGLHFILLLLTLDGTWLALVIAHLCFVLPYTLLALADPWRALDPRYARSAAALGAGYGRTLLRVVLPMLARPLLAAAAVGFAVSVSLYLPTLFAGAGRFATLTTEALTLAAGGDRRLLAAFALLQALLPLMAFALALALPAFLFRHRRGMMGH
jgi:putative thiamine transport system permease protein